MWSRPATRRIVPTIGEPAHTMRRQSPRTTAASTDSQQLIGDGAPRKAARSEWGTLKGLLPYLWEFRWRVGLALVFLVAAKAANVGVPFIQ